MIRYIFLALLFLSPHAKAVNYFDLYERAVNDDKEAITILMNHCFDEDTINREKGFITTTHFYGFFEDKETCREWKIDRWIDYAIDDGHAIAYYYKAKRTRFDDDGNYLYLLKQSARLGFDAAYLELAEHFERHKEFDESGVKYIKKAIEINYKRNEKYANIDLFESLYRTYSFGNIERRNFDEAYEIQTKIREEIYNGKYKSYFNAVYSNFFGLEGKIEYEKSLNFIQDSPVKSNNSYENIDGIKIIEALHYLYGLGVDKDVEEAFQILTEIYYDSDNLINLLLIICMEEMPSLDIFNNKSRYKKRLYNGANIYNKQVLEVENIERNIDIEMGLISLSVSDLVGAEKHFSKAIKNDDSGVAAYIFAKELILGGYSMPSKIIKLLEKASFKKHYGAMNELGLFYSNYVENINASKIETIESLFIESIKNNNHISNSDRNNYFNFCSSIRASDNILNISESKMEEICLKIIDEENFTYYGVGGFEIDRVAYTFRDYHSDIDTKLLYLCIAYAPRKDDLKNYTDFNTLRLNVDKKLYDLFQNGSVAALYKLFFLNIGLNDCFEGEINKEDAAMFYYAYYIMIDAYKEAGYRERSKEYTMDDRFNGLDLTNEELEVAKERASDLMNSVDLSKIN